MKIKSQQVRDSARGEDCTLNIAGVCSYDTNETILAHLPDESSGASLKADDISACYSCAACHDAIDRRNNAMPEEEREWYQRRAMVRTWRRLIEAGIVIIKGVKV